MALGHDEGVARPCPCLPNIAVPTGQALAERWAQIDRTAVPSPYGQTDPAAAGSTFLADVQAHSLRNGNIGGNDNLVQGGQLNLIQETPLI